MGNEASSSQDGSQRIPNDINLSWERLVFEDIEARDGHCACACDGKLYIFGGVKHGGGAGGKDGFHESNELLVFDPIARTCKVLNGGGDIPVSRSSAVLACVKDNLYLFGGLNADSGWFNDLHLYNTTTNLWKRIDLPSGPTPRDKMATTVVGSNIYIFGGFGPYCKAQVENAINKENVEEEEDEEEEEEEEEPLDDSNILDDESAKFGWFDDLYIFNTEINMWIQPVQMNLACPSPRAAHSMSATSRGVIIFGGRDKHGRNNDLHIYDTNSRKWVTDLSIAGKYPSARSFHSSVAVGDRVLVCGGRAADEHHFNDAHIFDSETLQWLQPIVNLDTNYTKRGVHTMNVVGDYIVMFGGSADFDAETVQCTTFLNDFYLLKKSDVLKGAALPEISSENDGMNVDEDGGGADENAKIETRQRK
ncbi:hypothetical protein HELRODRAFT_185029 [Helobdella robusta]|uniref:Uncharacterized protein n=1 Tax=Helobdella robusta TaxID=6412 RepID=T1FMB0_HELRO|nr:hypothetical protein HELRODRAFT_185029 [Helobdella robusta]ESN98682.1 hypothetical protein HELRODRAFT_185029 [Helobdella robusta]